MEFDNTTFEQKIKNSFNSLKELAKGLDAFSISNKKVNFQGMDSGAKGTAAAINGVSSAVSTLEARFSALGIAGMVALGTITAGAVRAGGAFAKAATVQPLIDGFREYELQMNSVQTIMGNTGRSVSDVNKVLDDLNHYADKTIYVFGHMTQNAGLFTAAGQGLEETATAIKGIGNWAAYAGASTTDMSRATYQLGQALATGSIRLMDWRSIENTGGMAGTKYQQAFIETARNHGVAVDSLIEKHGSFRESLSEGWLTTEIFMDTMNRFTTDGVQEYTKKMLQAGKITQDQANAMMAEATAMEDAATKVKTFSQLIDTAKEALGSGFATSWRTIIGDFEQAKELWTGVSDQVNGFIDRTSDARNEMLATWKTLGGRHNLIKGLGNVFQALGSVITPVAEGFRDIFPPMTGDRLATLTGKFRILTKSLILNEEAQSSLRAVSKGFFSVVKLGAEALKGVAMTAGNVLKAFSPLGKLFLSTAGSFGNMVSKFSQSIIDSGAIENLATGLSGLFESIGTGLQGFVSKIDTDAIFGSISNLLSKINFDSIVKGLSAGIKGLGEILKSFNSYALEFVKSLGLIGAGAGAVKLSTFLKNVSSAFSDFLDKFKSAPSFGIKDSLNEVLGVLNAYQTKLKADALIRIAAAVAILAGSIALLSSIDPAKTAGAVAALGAVMLELVGAMKLMSLIAFTSRGAIFSVAPMLAMAVAIGILGLALKGISNIPWDGIARGLVGLAGVMTLMTAVMAISSKVGLTAPAGIFGMISMAIAINLLGIALKNIGNLEIDQILKGLGGMVGVIGTMILLSRLMGTGLGVLSGAGLIGMAIALNLMALALSNIGSIDLGNLAKSTATIGALLAIIGVFTTMSAGGIALISTAIGLTIMAHALSSLANSLAQFGSMDLPTIGKGLATMAGALLILGVALTAMSFTIPGAFALMMAAFAISVLVPPLMALGNMNLGGIVQALVSMAVAFGIIGAAGLLLAPVIPALLGLSLALMAIGAAALMFGVGVTLITAGMTAIALAITTLAQVTLDGAAQIGENLVTMVETIAQQSSRMSESFVLIGQSMLNAIVELAPQMADAFMVVLDETLASIAEHMPSFIESGKKIVSAFAQGITENAPEPKDTLLAVIDAALSAIGLKNPLFETAGKALTAFLSGGVRSGEGNVTSSAGSVADAGATAARSKAPGFTSAGLAMASGLAGGIRSGISLAISAAISLATSALSAAKRALRIESPSKEFYEIGEQVVEGFANGLEDPEHTSKVVANIEKLVDEMAYAASDAKALDAAGLVITAGLNKAREMEDFADHIEGTIDALVGSYGDYISKSSDATDAVMAFSEALYRESDAFKTDQQNIKAHTREIQELVQKRKELNESLTTATDQNAIDEITRDIENTTNTIQTKIEQVEEDTRKVADNVRDTFLNLREGIEKSVAAFLDPMKLKLDTIDLFSDNNGLLSNQLDLDSAAASVSTSSLSMSSPGYDTSSMEKELDKAEKAVEDARKKSDAVEGRSQRFLDDLAIAEERAADARERLAEARQRATEVERESSQQTVQRTESLKEEKKTAESLLQTMRDQISTYTTWQEKIDTLVGSGLATGLLEELKSMGVKGSEEIDLFLSMTKEQIEEANDLYLTASKITSGTLIRDYKDAYNQTLAWSTKIQELAKAGLNQELLTSLAEEGPSGMEKVDAYLNMSKEQIAEINDLYKETQKLSMTVGDEALAAIVVSSKEVTSAMTGGIVDGLDEEAVPTIKTAEAFAEKVVGGIESNMNFSSGVTLAVRQAEGMIWGLKNKENAVVAAARRVAMAAYQAAMAALGIRSPSRVFKKIGEYTVEGFVQGIEQNSTLAAMSTKSMATGAISSMRNALSALDTLTDDIDSQPTIRPVMDLTNVRSGVNTISGMLEPSKSYNLAVRTGAGFTGDPRNQNGVSSQTTIDQSTHPVENNFYITGSNPKEIANEVNKILQTNVDRRRAAWGR